MIWCGRSFQLLALGLAQALAADPARSGTVFSESYFCQGGGGRRETTVLVPSVPNVAETGGGIEARYR